MFEKSLAVLITDVHHKENRHMIGEIVEVGNTYVESVDGFICFFSFEGKFVFNVRDDSVSFVPKYIFDVRKCEILEVFSNKYEINPTDWRELFQNVEVIDE